MTMIIDGTNGLTFPDTSKQYNSYYSFKNRIINGAMVIDQRNAGASITPTDGQYSVDRWKASLNVASKFSLQRSTVAPAGFTNSMLATSLSAYSIAAGEVTGVIQAVEGFNTADLGWGSASAQAVTLSFWVRSSLTGTFGGSLRNSAANRSYPFSYTISAANTWEQKSITIAGDTSGTWLTDNGVGIQLYFSFGSGSTFSSTAGAWAAGNFVSATGAVSVIGTLNATFYITGVQLEKGIVATSFDYRPYGTELALCQRYLPAFFSQGTADFVGCGQGVGTNISRVQFNFFTTPRVAPTGITVSSASHFSTITQSGAGTCSSVAFNSGGLRIARLEFNTSSNISNGQVLEGYANNASAYILFNGCEL